MSAIGHWVAHYAVSAGGSLLDVLKRPASDAINRAFPNKPPEPEQLIAAYIKDWIPAVALDVGLQGHGIASNVSGVNPGGEDVEKFKGLSKLWKRVVYSGQHVPSSHEAFTLANRGAINNDDMDQYLRRDGFLTHSVRQDLSHLRYEVPGPSDLVRFAVRHVFEPDLIEHLGYNDEYRPTLDIFHACQGLNYPILGDTSAYDVSGMEPRLQEASTAAVAQYAAAGLEIPTWAQCYWWAHWVLPSPSQGYQMLFRLRPDRITKYDPPEAKGLSFDLKDLNLLLRANDYPPFYRPYLAAISHATPGIRFLRQLVSTDVFGKEDIKDTLLRQGYSDGHAEVLTESVIRQDKLQRRKTVESQAKSQIERYWSLGIIDAQQFNTMLQQHGLSPDDAALTVSLADTQLQYERVKSIVTVLRTRFRKGKADAAQTRLELIQVGVRSDRADQYLQDWQLELQEKEKEVSAAQNVKWACQGLITLGDLISRLHNLGYHDEDIKILATEAEMCAADRAAKALANIARENEKAQKRLKQIQKDAQTAIRTAQAQLAKHGNPQQLRKWFCEGHIAELDVYNRLEFLGWPPADITRLISDCRTAKETKTFKIDQQGNVSGPTGTITESIP